MCVFVSACLGVYIHTSLGGGGGVNKQVGM